MEEKDTKNTTNSNQKENKTKNKRSRMYLVLLFIALTAIIMYVIYRGEYLEILELGENYLPIFWQNITYGAITFLVNFLIIFILVYIVNRTIKRGLKMFFDQEKKPMPKILNKSLALVIAIVTSFLHQQSYLIK